jgi:uncharacterized protein YprB with RNaseH-like and TPR domain
MSTIADRLRGVVTSGAGQRVAGSGAAPSGAEPLTVTSAVRRAPGGAVPGQDPLAVAEVLGGEWCTSRSQPFLIVDRKYAGGHRHGHVSILDSLPPDTGVWRRLALLAGPTRPLAAPADDVPRRLVFLDLETTGLAGGAGTYAFLVGCGWFEGAAFRVRQFFLSSFGAERAILEAVSELAGDAAAVVTFNGKSFDVPLIDTRFALHRLASPFGALPHVDMLHVARRFWRPRPAKARDERGRRAEGFFDDVFDADEAKAKGCRLSDLEQAVCGHEREGDVPGFEIPARYFHYVRSGDARGLEAVMEHNRLDLLSLALLTARASQMVEEGPTSATTAREALGLGLVYERAGLAADASAAYAHAAGRPSVSGEGHITTAAPDGDATTRAEALRAYALLARRERRFPDAARAWQRVLEIRRCPPQIAREAAEALAVHHEHRLRDLDVARRFAVQSLQYRSTPTRTQAVHVRLKRLDRKMGRPPGAEALS